MSTLYFIKPTGPLLSLYGTNLGAQTDLYADIFDFDFDFSSLSSFYKVGAQMFPAISRNYTFTLSPFKETNAKKKNQ